MSGSVGGAEGRFEAAVSFIQNLPKSGESPITLTNEDKLRFYALYKQAKDGSCNTPPPGFFDVVGRYKHEAWKKLGDMPKEQAMKSYVDELVSLVDKLPPSAEKSRFIDAVTPVRNKREEDQVVAATTTATTTTPAQLRNVATEEEETELGEAEERLAREVDALKDSVMSDSLKVARLEALLSARAPSSSDDASITLDAVVARELVDALGSVGKKLEQSRLERETYNAALEGRLAELEQIGARIDNELKKTQSQIASFNWLVGLGVAVPVLVVGAVAVVRIVQKYRK